MLSDYNRRVVRTNLLILLAGAALFGGLAKLSGGGSLAFLGFQIGVQALANVLFGLVHSLGEFDGTAAGYWLSALLVLIIGPGCCGAAAVWVF